MYKTLIKLVKKLATLTNMDKSYSVFVYVTVCIISIRIVYNVSVV